MDTYLTAVRMFKGVKRARVEEVAALISAETSAPTTTATHWADKDDKTTLVRPARCAIRGMLSSLAFGCTLCLRSCGWHASHS